MAKTPAGSVPRGGGGAAGGESAQALHAWLYEVMPDGTSHPIGDARGQATAAVEPGTTLHVSVGGGKNTASDRYLNMPPAEGMSGNPVTVSMDPATGFWMIKNSGQTNTLRVQEYGLHAVPLRPRAWTPMYGRDAAVWIPVLPGEFRRGNGESFRLLILSGSEKQDAVSGPTRAITVPRIFLSEAKKEALVAYFGDYLSWPPLPAPHVRQMAEVEQIAYQHGLSKEPSTKLWARNRFDVLAGKGGLFADAEWYPRLGGAGRTLANHLPAFYRLVELRAITLQRALAWTKRYDLAPYVIIAPGRETQAEPGAAARKVPAPSGDAPPARIPGSQIAGYRLERVVGSGGRSTVFRARDESGQLVALKLLRSSPESRSGLSREKQAMDLVHHPNIIRPYVEGTDKGYAYIAMEFVDGENLNTIIDRGIRLSPGRTVEYLAPVASALDALHAAGLVHRDVKPNNILAGSRPGEPQDVYLTDFGIATPTGPGEGPAAPGPFLGTPHYASPEQIAGARVDGRADQYSLACVAYVLLSGSTPFWEHTTTELITKDAVEEPPRLTAVRPDLPDAADLVLAKAMARAPEGRFDSCTAFVEALRRALGV